MAQIEVLNWCKDDWGIFLYFEAKLKDILSLRQHFMPDYI